MASKQNALRRLAVIDAQVTNMSVQHSRSELLFVSCTSGEQSPRVGFIGGGQMATALASGMISSGFTSKENVTAGDRQDSSRQAFEQKTGGRSVTKNEEAIIDRDIIILSIKPQSMKGVLSEIRNIITERHLLVSIVAGYGIQSIIDGLSSEGKTRDDLRVVRVMPNTPSLIGKGATAYSLGGKASQKDAQIIEKLFSSVGVAAQVPETLIDAVTGVSGSGPAYVYQFVEALSDGGVKAGLPRDIATRLAAQTVYGAAGMILETGEHPACLKDRVTSPGGTTIAGVHALEQGGMRSTVMNAVQAAAARAAELGRL